MNIEDFGYRVRTYEGFMSGAVDIYGERADEIREALRERAALFVNGSHVVYDPHDNEDGWLLVGEEKAIRARTLAMIKENEQ